MTVPDPFLITEPDIPIIGPATVVEFVPPKVRVLAPKLTVPEVLDKSPIVVPVVVALMSKIPELSRDTREESLIDPEPDNASVPAEIIVLPE